MFAQFPNGTCYACPPYPPVVPLNYFPSPCICMTAPNAPEIPPPSGSLFGAPGSQQHQRPEAGRDSVRAR